jgi:hypothetical protein
MLRVLHERIDSHVHVRLLWESQTNGVQVVVRDRASGDSFVVIPDSADALVAFYHPFCFDAAAKVDTRLAA